MSFIGKCKCCLENGGLKNLWAEYYRSGEKEVYGEMLIECFALTWQQPDETEEHIEEICEGCIARLHDAYNFKKQVLASEELLQEEIRQSKDLKQKIKIKVETDSDEENVLLKYEPDFDNETEYKCETDSETIPDFLSKGHADDDCLEYEEIEFLDDEFEDQEGNKNYMTSDNESSTSKQPSRKRGRNVKRPYKDYPEEKLLEAIKAVVNEDMTPVEAADSYNVPLKTLRGRLQSKMKGEEGSDVSTNQHKVDRSLEMKLMMENVRSFLRWSNATPLHGHWGVGFACSFCSKQYPEAEDLKTHTIESHDKEEIRNAKCMRKTGLESGIKLDITNLHCNLCHGEVESIEALAEHLQQQHDKEIHGVPNPIVPYKFMGAGWTCYVCEEKFFHFSLLSKHMNSHYKNYVCEDCGQGYISRYSIHAHRQRHRKDQVCQCSYCPKMFTSAIQRREHESYKHKNQYRTHKCGYCTEKFCDISHKEDHEALAHGATRKSYLCSACARCFKSQKALAMHIKLYHLMVRPYACGDCEKTFGSSSALKRHRTKHGEISVVHKCEICFKDFSRKSTLRIHMRIHYKDKQFKCSICSKEFVQKVSLIMHYKSRHPGSVFMSG